MDGFNKVQKEVLVRHLKAVVHMRKRLADSKFSLVFGAGISIDFGIPTWEALIKDIAKDKNVNGLKLFENNKDRPYASRTQVLFYHFAAKLVSRDHGRNMSEGEIKSKWRNILRKQLYKKGKKVKDVKRNHPYITSFIEIIKNSPMTVNYNFDDYIEHILQGESTQRRLCETTWDPQLQTKLNKCVIYHPNGFLPKHEMERQSEGLVFCEDEFADQLIETMAGRYASLLHHYSQNTCLFIGLSLDDVTLKHLLRQSAKLNPGHYHYYVVYQNATSMKPKKEQEAIFEANFNLYNLITLFLSNEEIKELGNLINLPNEPFIHKAGSDGFELMHCYYVVGAIRAGKSTIISHFRNLFTHDEWPDFRIPELGMDWESLTNRQKAKVDNWIAKQFKEKNSVLCDSPESVMGLHIIDRSPLDPISFTNANERAQKASFLIDKICTGENGFRIKKGHVILLEGDPELLEKRAKASGKKYNSDKLEKMQNDLRRIYASQAGGVTIINTKNISTERIVKEVGSVIHRKQYKELNLHRRLVDIKEGRFKC